MATINVTGVIHHTDDTPWVNADIRITRRPSSHAADIVYPVDAIKLTTDATGNLEYTAPDGTVTTGVDLWVTDEGVEFSYYTLHLPDNTSFSFLLPAAIGTTVDINTLKANYLYPAVYSYNITVQSYVENVVSAGGSVSVSTINALESFYDSIPLVIPKIDVMLFSGTETADGAGIPFIDKIGLQISNSYSVTVDGNGNDIYPASDTLYSSTIVEDKGMSFAAFDIVPNSGLLVMGDTNEFTNSGRYSFIPEWNGASHVDCDFRSTFPFTAGARFVCVNSGSNAGATNDLYHDNVLVATNAKTFVPNTEPYSLYISSATKTLKALIWADLLTDTETVELYNALINNF